MRLEIRIPTDLPADHPDVTAKAHDACAQQASAWTEPVHIGETTANGQRVLIFATDAQPKANPSVTTTANVAPALMPPHVL